MLYAYTAQNNEEITVGEGDEFVLVEPDGEFLPRTLFEHS
jgi:hypothetical protein